MQSDDLTLKVLIEIRDQIRSTNQRVDQTNMQLDQTNLQLDSMRDELGRKIDGLGDQLGRQIVESEIRTATAITDLHGTMRDVHVLLRDRFDLRDRVERCERDIDELKHRVG